jgi:hypothetical protein
VIMEKERVEKTCPKWTSQRGVGSSEPNLGKQIACVHHIDLYFMVWFFPLSLVLLLVIDLISICIASR